MTTSPAWRPRARTLIAGAAAALAVGVAAAPANANGITLDWSTVNVANSAAPSNTERTWLGYVTNPTPGQGARGTASPIAPATGSTVTPQSPRGMDATAEWNLPLVSGSFDPFGRTGAFEFDGGVSFVSPGPSPMNGHGFTITIEDPRIELTGDGNGFLYATGLRTNGADTPPVPYDRSQAVFRLSRIAWNIGFDGANSLTFVPEVAVSEYVFPIQYPAGSGPNRTPNTLGSLSIDLPTLVGPKGDKGDTGPAGRNGTNGTNGANGRNGTNATIRVQTSSLGSAPFRGKAARKVRVTARKSTRTLATGTVKGRSLTITLARGVKKKQLKGKYVLRLQGGKKGSAVVTLP